MELTEILALIPEDKREAAKAAVESMLADVRKKGENASGFTRRQAEKAEKELAETQAKLHELEGKQAPLTDLQKQLADAQKELDRSGYFRAEFEDRKFRELIGAKVALTDDAYMDHLLRVTQAKLAVTEKDGKYEYALENEDRLAEYAAAPENAHRIKTGTGDRTPSFVPSAPPVNATGRTIDDPVQKAQFDALPPASREAVLRRLQKV